MPKFEVTLEAIVYAPVKIVIEEADSKESAIDAALDLLPSTVHDAMDAPRNGGWKAYVDWKAPKGVKLAAPAANATVIATTSGARARKL